MFRIGTSLIHGLLTDTTHTTHTYNTTQHNTTQRTTHNILLASESRSDSAQPGYRRRSDAEAAARTEQRAEGLRDARTGTHAERYGEARTRRRKEARTERRAEKRTDSEAQKGARGEAQPVARLLCRTQLSEQRVRVPLREGQWFHGRDECTHLRETDRRLPKCRAHLSRAHLSTVRDARKAHESRMYRCEKSINQ